MRTAGHNRHNRANDTCRCQVQERFRSQFRQRLTDFLFRQGSAAEGFGIVWEKTLDEVPLDELSQAELYRELIAWVRGEDLFAGRKQVELLQAWRETAWEF